MISALSMHYRKEEELRKRRAALERWQQEQLARSKEIVTTKDKAVSNNHLTVSPGRPPQQSVSEPALHKSGTNGNHQVTRQPSPSSAHSRRNSPNPSTCASAQSKPPKVKRASKEPKAKK